MGLQFGPQLLLLPWSGYAADRFMPYVTGGAAFGDIRASTPGFPTATAGLVLANGQTYTKKEWLGILKGPDRPTLLTLDPENIVTPFIYVDRIVVAKGLRYV